MCIKVSRDEQLQARSCARVQRSEPTWREGRALLLDALVSMARAGGGLLIVPGDETVLLSGRMPQHLVPTLRHRAARAADEGTDGVDIRFEPDGLRQGLRLRHLMLLVLREHGVVMGTVVMIDLPAMDDAAHRALHAMGLALANQLRMERQAQAAALQAQRVEDVAYASGDWLWETDAAGVYTWILRDQSRGLAGDAQPEVGQAMQHAQVVDWVGEPVSPPLSLQDVLDKRHPVVRLVSAERDGERVRFVSRSAVPVLAADGVFLGYRGSARDVTESVQAKAELWRREHQLLQMTLAKEEAEAANRAKSVLVSKVGHELRTPLNAIVGLAQLIRMRQRPGHDGGPVDRWVDQIARTGGHMADTIEVLMELGRSASGCLRVGGRSFEVEDVLNEAIRIVEPEAWRRGIVIALGGDTRAMVHADRRAVRQVFVNLLSNAVKYNAEHGGVSLVVRSQGEGVSIKVRDTGPGLTPEQRARLFQPFDRLGAEKSNVQGHGLGLLISRDLLAAMDGSIAVDSSVGGGCTFTVTLPAAVVRCEGLVGVTSGTT
ncbi:sensor histidine kinase [Piscinibacter terrae]|uniref:histidine kinase n=1 Tax=Piscinibacter terrae TaxID=2496871 RepID=A0A3N7HVE8_9BURK|nr:HAMP domain-containing sensor histidine kinase [Albitalea terrae]RQP26277.1 sensor histidine kinase [Albitalea terrae]